MYKCINSVCTIIIVNCSWDGLLEGRNCSCAWSLCSVDQKVTVQSGSVLDVRGPEWFCQSFCSLRMSSFWRVGSVVPMIHSAVRSTLRSLLRSDYWLQIRKDTVTENNCFFSANYPERSPLKFPHSIQCNIRTDAESHSYLLNVLSALCAVHPSLLEDSFMPSFQIITIQCVHYRSKNWSQKDKIITIFFKEMYTLIQQGCITLIKSDSKLFYDVTKDL